MSWICNSWKETFPGLPNIPLIIIMKGTFNCRQCLSLQLGFSGSGSIPRRLCKLVFFLPGRLREKGKITNFLTVQHVNFAIKGKQ